MEFKQAETKAALSLMDNLREKMESESSLSTRLFEEIEEMKKLEVKPVLAKMETTEHIAIRSSLESELLKRAIDDLRIQIESQKFDY